MNRWFVGLWSLAVVCVFAAEAAAAQQVPALTPGERMLRGAASAAAIDPALWSWPSSAADPAVRASIVNGGYTKNELRNIYTVLELEGGTGGKMKPVATMPHAGSPIKPGAMPGFGAIAALMAPNTINHGRGFRGLEVFFGSNGYTPTGLTERTNSIDYIIAKGDRVYESWVIHARHTGVIFGFPGDGKLVQIHETAQVRFTPDGRIAETNYIGDNFALYTQLGGKVAFPKGKAP